VVHLDALDFADDLIGGRIDDGDAVTGVIGQDVSNAAGFRWDGKQDSELPHLWLANHGY